MNEETLASVYQPPPPDDTRGILHRYRFLPPGAGPTDKFPTVLMFPPDVYYLGYSDHGNPGERVASHDLQYAGFLVFQVNHRLAPSGSLTGQHSSGIAPAQTDDAKRQILAALADSQCNGSIYLVGGSAGGTLALWCGLDSVTGGATGSVQGWDNSVRLHIKAVVSFSGPTNLYDWSHPDIPDYTEFETRADKYVGLVPINQTETPLDLASPTHLIATGLATNSPPVRLYASQYDTVSWTQEDDMYNELSLIGTTVTKTFFPGSDKHAYDNWHVIDPNTTNCVSTDVIDFFQSHP